MYCQTEQLMRLAAMACGYRLAACIGTSTVALAHAVLKRPVALLTAPDAASWAEGINTVAERIRRTLEPAKAKTLFGACPACGAGVWGDPGQHMGICAGWRPTDRQMARGRRAARTTRRNRGHGHSRPTQPRMRQGRHPPARQHHPRLDPQRQAPDRPERACKPQSARAPAVRTRGTAMRHIDLRFCEGIVSYFFGVIGSPQCKSLKTLEFEACRAPIVSESCLETPKNRV